MIQKTKRFVLSQINHFKRNITENKDRKLKESYAGIHLIADFWEINNIIDDGEKIKEILIEAAKRANNIPLEVAIHKFTPQGVTGVILLAESHISLHLWPEIKYLAVDVFTCGDHSMPEKALEFLKETFEPRKVDLEKIKRGLIKKQM